MKKLFSLLCLFPFVSTNLISQPEAIWQLLQNGSIIRWAYAGGDEFDGNQLNYGKWDDAVGGVRSNIGNKELEYYMPGSNNIEISNGKLKLIAKDEPGFRLVEPWHSGSDLLSDGQPNARFFPYTSGMIQSKQGFKFGLYEIVFKTPVGKGLWPAFWLHCCYPNEEIDVFEYKGETPNKIHINQHCPAGCISNGGGWYTANGNFSDGFNNMMLEWGSGDILFWYLNGQEFAYTFADFNKQFNVIANLAVAGNCPAAFCPGPDGTTTFPAAFEIEYIRFWQRMDCQQTINMCNYSQTNTDLTMLTGSQITFGGTGSCNATIAQNKFLDLIATNNIDLLPGFTVEAGSTFNAKIVACPNPQIENPDYIKNISASNDLNIVHDNKNSSRAASVWDQSTLNKSALLTKIYPNPSNGIIKIEFSGKINQEIKIEIINSVGQIVYSKDNIKDDVINIDVSFLSKGIYYLKGTFDKSTITEKINIQ